MNSIEKEKTGTFESIADWLTYRSYAWNRFHNPSIEVSRWVSIYPRAFIYEAIFLKNQKRKNND